MRIKFLEVFIRPHDYLKGGRVKRSLVCTSSVATLPAALPGTRRVSTRQGWAGEEG